jgi:dihydrofolate reductase
MAHISTYLQVSLDGYFAGPDGEIDWFTDSPDPELEEYSFARARGGSTLLFGRRTYELMARAWTADASHEDRPDMTEVMANSRKIVFSKTMQEVNEGPRWRNVELRREIDAHALRSDDRSFTTLGSGSIVQQLSRLGLVDEYSLLVNPIVLGTGKSAVTAVPRGQLELTDARSFKSGVVWLTYARSGC